VHAVLNAAVPIVALIFTGYVCGRCGVLSPAATDSLNRFAIHLALPALMFLAMSRVTPGQAAQHGFVLAFAGGIAITFALGFALSRLRGRRVATARIEALGASYSNVGFMGFRCACWCSSCSMFRRPGRVRPYC
jgi:malonate transporter